MDDDLVRAYALEAQKAMDAEAKRRIEETSDPEEDHRLRNMSLHEVLDSEHLVPALCARLGSVRACLLYTSPSPRDGLLSRMPSSA